MPTRGATVAQRIETVADARHFAERRLPRFLYQRYEAGTGKGITAAANTARFDDIGFVERTGTFVGTPRLATTVLGTPVRFPVLCGPVGALRIGHPAGETGVARAASKAGTIAVMSSASGSSIEDFAAAAIGPVFFQLHYYGGPDCAGPMLERARAAGCAALLVTVDAPAPMSARERPVPAKAFAPRSLAAAQLLRVLPQVAARPTWLAAFARRPGGLAVPMAPAVNGNPVTVFTMTDVLYARAPTIDDIPTLKSLWAGPIAVKGVLSVTDAQRARDAGADGIVVSNHGGNGLDGRPASITVLPRISEAVGHEVEVLMDGGIRRGADVVKALALGARAVLLGRAYVYALMAAGEPGVTRILDIFRGEIDSVLRFLGTPDVTDLDRSCVSYPADW
jgi:isopentenyl diphosphate isomerase/L-lactate dehydrogenase-like FMN-dependent dehydrogenase